MRKKVKVIARLGRRKVGGVWQRVFGIESLLSGYISPEMHQNFYCVNQVRKDIRL